VIAANDMPVISLLISSLAQGGRFTPVRVCMADPGLPDKAGRVFISLSALPAAAAPAAEPSTSIF
jgi:hypothetical protein